MDDLTRPLVSLTDSADIAAALPYLVGFHPHESVVLVALGGPTGNRVGLTVRADLPARAASAAVATALARSVATDDPAGVVVAVVSEAPDDRGPLRGGGDVPGLPDRDVADDVVVALAALDVPLRDALLVQIGCAPSRASV